MHLFLSIVLSLQAFAEDDSETTEKVDVSDTVSGVTGRAPSLNIEDVNSIHGAALYDGAKSREYPDRIYDGAKWLKSTPEFVWTCWEVMNALYKRDNKGIHAILDRAKKRLIVRQKCVGKKMKIILNVFMDSRKRNVFWK